MTNYKEIVLKANLALKKAELIVLTWGNVSVIDRAKGLVTIKPSGVEYDEMKAEDMTVLDLDGNIIGGKLRPSSDTPTHLMLYKAFTEINCIVHTHSTYATAWAQAGESIPIIGTTHADYFSQDIPCTRDMTEEEIMNDYEKNTANVIIETFKEISPVEIPSVLVKNHGPFSWGLNAEEAIANAIVLEEIAKIASISYALNPSTQMNNYLVNKHYLRKHGKNAYYGQNIKNNG